MVTIARVALFAEFILTEWAAPAGIGLDGGKMPIHGRESFVRSLGFLSELLRLTQDQLFCWDNPNKFLRFYDWRRMAYIYDKPSQINNLSSMGLQSI